MHLGNCAMTPFRDFLLEQIERRQMTKRAFAEFIEIDESSLYRFLKESDPDSPSDDTLVKIHRKTSIPLATLIELRDPGISREAHLSAHAQFLAQKYQNMSVEDRRVIDAIFDSLAHGRSFDNRKDE
jgi:predicted transcriptional regulator